MRFRYYTIFGILGLFCLCMDVLTFGGLAREGDVGAAITKSAHEESPLAYTYIVLGRPIATAAPVAQTVGQSIADAAFGDAYEKIRATPEAAGELLFSASFGPLRSLLVLCYWGAPLFLALAILTWVFRTRETHLIKSTRR